MQFPVPATRRGPARLLSAITVAAAAATAVFWLVVTAAGQGNDLRFVILFGGFALMLTITGCYGWVIDRVWRRSYREAGEAASAFKDEFIARVAHELRSPLTGIVGYAQRLEPDNESNEEAVRQVVAQSAEMSRLIDDLVTTARLDAELLTVEPQAVSVKEEAEVVAEFVRLLGAEVSVELSDAQVEVDRDHFRHILRNLLVNGYRHGSSKVSVRGQACGDEYICQVVDQGGGIPEEMETQLFSRFVHQGEDGRLPGSMGLGLAVVGELAKQMKCVISYRRIKGETHFVIALPIAEGSRRRERGIHLENEVSILELIRNSKPTVKGEVTQ